jgi:hypothetical protein
MDFAHALGLNKKAESPEEERQKLQLYINLQLASSGQPIPREEPPALRLPLLGGPAYSEFPGALPR